MRNEHKIKKNDEPRIADPEEREKADCEKEWEKRQEIIAQAFAKFPNSRPSFWGSISPRLTDFDGAVIEWGDYDGLKVMMDKKEAYIRQNPLPKPEFRVCQMCGKRFLTTSTLTCGDLHPAGSTNGFYRDPHYWNVFINHIIPDSSIRSFVEFCRKKGYAGAFGYEEFYERYIKDRENKAHGVEAE